jgi:hypothetical protein
VLEAKGQKKTPIKPSTTSYSGLNGGIQMLIDEQYFDTPRSGAEVIQKLKEKGYHYGSAAVLKALANYFMKRDRKLGRLKEGKIWKYAIRK